MQTEAELAVVIIFNDPPVFLLLGPGKKRLSSAKRGDDTCGKMVGGRNMQHIGVSQFFRYHTLAVHRNAFPVHAAGSIDLSDLFISRFFHTVAYISAQKLDQQIVKKVRACADEDIVLRHFHSPKGRQVTDNGTAQFQ